MLRGYDRDDADELKRTIDENLEYLRAWMSWANAEPSELLVVRSRLAGYREAHLAGHDLSFGIFRRHDGRETLIGGAGIHPGEGGADREIGYWVAEAWTRRGIATEVAGALTRVCIEYLDASRVEIRCDPRNVASASVARKLGYRLEQTLSAHTVDPRGLARDTMVWAFFAETPLRGLTSLSGIEVYDERGRPVPPRRHTS